MNAQQIVLIRHGEKVNEQGMVEQVHLSTQGKLRAKEYIEYFEHKCPAAIKKPSYIVAMKQKKKTSSNRCVETVNPLAQSLGINVESKFTRDDIDGVYKSLQSNKYKGRVVLVCWEHDALVDIAKRFGVPVEHWGSKPNTEEEKTNFSSIWVLERQGIKGVMLKVYPGFKITETNQIEYENNIDTPVFQASRSRDFEIETETKKSWYESLCNCF
jgi:broad specificity phosphatase PhoE